MKPRQLAPGLRAMGRAVKSRRGSNTVTVQRGEPILKTIQGHVAHSVIRTTMNLYMQDEHDEKQAAQGAFLSVAGPRGAQCSELSIGL